MTHDAIASIATPDLEQAVAAARLHDLAEIRLDALWPKPPEVDAAADALERLSATGTRLLATLRPKRQGGSFEGPEDVRVSLLVAAARAGFEAIDIETDLDEAPRLVASLRKEAKVIVSDHTLHDMPSRDAGLRRLQAMQDLRAHREKLAVPCGSFVEALRALELAHAHRDRHGHPAIAPLGGGALLRAAMALAGNASTYGHAEGLRAAADGQPALRDIEAAWTHWGLAGDFGDGDWLAVLGDPVAHSLSPRIHNAALRAAGRSQRYGALQVPDSIGAVRLLVTAASRIGLQGASVTAPLKQHAAKVAEGDESVHGSGAANCLRFGDTCTATNTDATAFRRLLQGDHVAILGSGGAGRAAAWAALADGRDVTIIARRQDAVPIEGARIVAWADRDQVQADTWVQATPAPQAVRLGGARQAIELVYKDGPTAFEAAARKAGAEVIDGKTFLVEQALDAFRFWFGEDADRAVMEAVL